jgi:hypothetical protein
MTKKHIHPPENTCFDFIIGISGWLFGCFEGIVMGIVLICSEKNEESDLVDEVEIFMHEMHSGYSTGKKDTKLIGKVL